MASRSEAGVEATAGSPTNGRRHPSPFDFTRFPNGESRLVSAAFSDLDEARAAVTALEHRGYPPNRISVVLTDETRRHLLRTHPEFEGFDPDTYLVDRVALDRENKVWKGVGAGGTIGGTVGAIAAAVAAIGTTAVISPLGIIVAGPLAAAFSGAAAGGAVGVLVGGLTGAGMSEYRARHLERMVSQGTILVIGHARTEPELRQIQQTLGELGGLLVPPEQSNRPSGNGPADRVDTG